MYLILPSSVRPAASISLASGLAGRGFDGIWVGERAGADAPARMASLAAAVVDGTVGMGPVSLTERTTAHLRETLTTAGLLAPGRLRVAFELPRTVGGASRPGWLDLLSDAAAVVRGSGLAVEAAAHDVVSAVLAASSVDRIIVRGVDIETTRRLVEALDRSGNDVAVEVWLDAAPEQSVLRALLAERLVVPGVPGGSLLRSTVRGRHPDLHGDIDRAYAVGDLIAAAGLVPNELVEATCLTGGAEVIARRLADYAAAGAAAIGVVPHGHDIEARLAAAGAVADAVEAA